MGGQTIISLFYSLNDQRNPTLEFSWGRKIESEMEKQTCEEGLKQRVRNNGRAVHKTEMKTADGSLCRSGLLTERRVTDGRQQQTRAGEIAG